MDNEKAAEIINRISGVVLNTTDGKTPEEKLEQVSALLPGKMDEFLSKHKELPVLWHDAKALMDRAVPVFFHPRVMTWLGKQAFKNDPAKKDS